jgi:hypothetical protein
MKKKLFYYSLLIIIALCTHSLEAQGTIYLDSNLYDQIDEWINAGLVLRTPIIRPYTIQCILNIASEVEVSDLATVEQRVHAQEIISNIKSGFHTKIELETRFTQELTQFNQAKISGSFSGLIDDNISLAAELCGWLIDGEGGWNLPYLQRPTEDYIYDNTHFSLGEKTIEIRQMGYSLLGFNSADRNLSVQLGVSRNSVGPFWGDSIILGANAPVAGHISYYYQQKWFDFQSAFLIYSDKETMGTNLISEGSLLSSDKYFFFHVLRVFPTKNINISIFETEISKGTIETLNFIPVASYFQMQGLSSFSGTAFLGINLVYYPIAGINSRATFYADDIGFNEVIQFNFDTKWKFAVQFGCDVNFKALIKNRNIFVDLFPSLFIDYSAIMPYTYTHNQADYTAWGVSIGPELEPNSDRINFQLGICPLSAFGENDLGLLLKLKYIRHGNASMGITEGDGTINDTGFTVNNVPTFEPSFFDVTGQPHTRFLTQELLEKRMAVSFCIKYNLNKIGYIETRTWGELFFEAEYTLEMIENNNFVGGEKKQNNYFNISLGYKY